VLREKTAAMQVFDSYKTVGDAINSFN
jgi:hypothetical protein